MKKVIYLFVTTVMFIFMSCGGGEAASEEVTAAETIEVTKCGDECQKACCLGCKATEGEKRCIVLKDGSMPCCIVDYNVDIEYEEGYGEESHEGHNHE